ncbi:hypothetical protein J2Z76_002104 [Sedimentibacter acidaminivorans]|uniref:DUF4860 domain-containing protein n=1 Tax=Sedimentibacter acidaminivorans TaxID=913099 RepID=A0ABS4GEX3_9FIRM|nr:DUF4860 domain-containing protein [Sedimentibacter acidaminivorans]MBP1926239.1 hypothetical protein [Sedimentibacter acidaminivorans]
MKRKKHISSKFSIQFIFIMLLFLIIVILSIMIINLGKEIYISINNDRTNNYELRVSLSYISNKIRQADKKSMVDIRDFNGNPAIVIKETYDGLNYENWIYYNDNNIYEILIDEGESFGIYDGMKVLEVDNFNISKINDNLYKISVVEEGRSSDLVISLYSVQRKTMD